MNRPTLRALACTTIAGCALTGLAVGLAQADGVAPVSIQVATARDKDNYDSFNVTNYGNQCLEVAVTATHDFPSGYSQQLEHVDPFELAAGHTAQQQFSYGAEDERVDFYIYSCAEFAASQAAGRAPAPLDHVRANPFELGWSYNAQMAQPTETPPSVAPTPTPSATGTPIPTMPPPLPTPTPRAAITPRPGYADPCTTPRVPKRTSFKKLSSYIRKSDADCGKIAKQVDRKGHTVHKPDAIVVALAMPAFSDAVRYASGQIAIKADVIGKAGPKQLVIFPKGTDTPEGTRFIAVTK